MNWFTKTQNIFRMLFAFRHCGLWNAWRMALETNEVMRETIAVPYPDPAEAKTLALESEAQPYGLLPAPKEES